MDSSCVPAALLSTCQSQNSKKSQWWAAAEVTTARLGLHVHVSYELKIPVVVVRFTYSSTVVKKRKISRLFAELFFFYFQIKVNYFEVSHQPAVVQVFFMRAQGPHAPNLISCLQIADQQLKTTAEWSMHAHSQPLSDYTYKAEPCGETQHTTFVSLLKLSMGIMFPSSSSLQREAVLTDTFCLCCHFSLYIQCVHVYICFGDNRVGN